MDPRVTKLAEVLVHYSLEIKAGQQFAISTSPLAEELALAVYSEALRTGANVTLWYEAPEEQEIFFKLATDPQLEYVSPVKKLIFETFDATLHIGAERNTRALSHIDPAKQARHAKAHQPVFEIVMQRSARKELHWCYTAYPTQAAAQEAEMSLSEYQDFVYAAGKLNEPDPIAAWQREGQRQRELQAWLRGKDQVVLKGPDVDLRFSIAGRTFVVAEGKENFPDGEIYTSPVEDSANGWIRFRYPGIMSGREVTDVELWFEQGKVVREKATKGEELLTSLLNSDPGARYLGEWGIGTNYDIPRFTKDMLFDEKLGGTIHLAVGAGFPEAGGRNKSGLHWDLLCDMAEGEIVIDGEVFYRQGKPVLWGE
jgi:aminopeptidase